MYFVCSSVCKGSPLGELYRCVEERIRVKVHIRTFKGLRGVCSGFVVAFDKFWNMVSSHTHVLSHDSCHMLNWFPWIWCLRIICSLFVFVLCQAMVDVDETYREPLLGEAFYHEKALTISRVGTSFHCLSDWNVQGVSDMLIASCRSYTALVMCNSALWLWLNTASDHCLWWCSSPQLPRG